MSVKDPKRSQQPRGQASQPARTAPQSSTVPGRSAVAPGKRTRTQSLPSGPAGTGAPVQRRPDPMADPARPGRIRLTDRWIDTAIRPDLHPPPVQLLGDDTQSPGDVHRLAEHGISGGTTALPHLDRIQRSFGSHDVSDIEAHIGGPAAEASRAMGAAAYATGNQVAFRSSPDLHTAAHEAAHVIQQRSGVQLAGGVGRAGDAYEQHADAVADRVVRGEPVEHLLVGHGVAGSHGAVQLAVDDGLAAHQGASVGQPGRISAPADQYEHARSVGVNVRARPDGTLPAIGQLRYNTKVHVQSLDVTGAFCFIMAGSGGGAGWINRDFVALDMPDVHAELHHITEPDLTTILKLHYVDRGLWRLGTGNDYTTLAAAVVAANQGRKGVRIDWDEHRAYKDAHPLKRTLDPWMIDNFAVYHASTVYAGHNIWLPSAAYVQMLQGAGVIGSRPDWVNDAVDVGQGIAGFHAGMHAGVFGSLWDTLVGLWQLGGTIVDTIAGILDGSLFQSIQRLYDDLAELDWADAERMVEEVLTLGKAAFGDFMAQWQHPDTFKKWYFRGRIAGAVALEVVLAIFSGGASLGAKVLARIGKYFPRLMKVLEKLLAVADELDFGKKGRHRPGKDSDRDQARGRDEDSDSDRDDNEQRDWKQTLALARLITEEHDRADTPVGELLQHLNSTLAVKSKAVHGFRAYPHTTKPGHHRIVQFSRESDVDKDYSGAGSDAQASGVSPGNDEFRGAGGSDSSGSSVKSSSNDGSHAPRPAPPERLVNALRDFQSRTFWFGNNTFRLDRASMKHILERHHPYYWNGSTRALQSFFPERMSIDDITEAIGAVLRQNRDTLLRRGTNRMYQIQGSHDGVRYVLGINNGRVGQFYPP